MDDQEIIGLYWSRSEQALSATEEKYGGYCYAIAYRILENQEDAEECVNDAYLNAWNAIPPHRPQSLPAFLGKIARNAALNRYKRDTARKRGQGQVELALSELEECVPAVVSIEQGAEDREVTESLEKFLRAQPAQKRKLFLRRYWYLSSIRELTEEFGMSEAKVKSLLFRMRKDWKRCLEKEGIVL